MKILRICITVNVQIPDGAAAEQDIAATVDLLCPGCGFLILVLPQA